MTLDRIQIEIKGNELRKALRGEDKRRYKQAIGYIDVCFNLLQQVLKCGEYVIIVRVSFERRCRK
jgi:hypothetical protein